MLQIKQIRKQYKTGDLVQTALDGVSLTLRDNEFVAILGPSGSGKTTLLNVIGGLDRYDSGDLIINGISTRKYSDRDWDSYRNHTIGFVFQSYNLIPHQTVLANVELALTISGISGAERRRRATKALEDVGLGDQLHKRPNQMSGGQMQRVAIARALVNDPDILLADEPTGALDSDTSVQIMELLKEVAKDRLVVMVTHNPELAYAYANRIVRVKDGHIVDDTNPYEAPVALAEPKHRNMGKSSMSFFTAMSLSFNNLRTKKARTILTAFAGSIGIIGIALIMSISTGFQLYIDRIQEDTLSNYPLSITSESSDMSSLLSAYGASMSMASQADDGVVVEQPMISQMFANIASNDLAAFKAYIEENADQIAGSVNEIKYSYGIKPRIYSADTSEKVTQVNPGTLFGEITGSSAMSAYMDSDIFKEMITNTDLLSAQYDVLEGRWPENFDEMIVVLQDPSQISDYMAYTLGLKDSDSLLEMIAKVMRGETVEQGESETPETWTYDDLLSLSFRLVPVSDTYRYNEEYHVWEDMSDDKDYMRALVENGTPLKIVGIVCPKEGISATMLTAGIAYTRELTEYVIAQAEQSQIVTMQLADPAIDVFTGKEFGAKDEDEDSSLKFEDMISVDEGAISSAFGMNINMDSILALLENYMQGITGVIEATTEPARIQFTQAFEALSRDMLQEYVLTNSTNGTAKLYLTQAEALVDAYLAGESAQAILSPLCTQYGIALEDYVSICRPLMFSMLTGYISDNLAIDTANYSLTAASELLVDTEPTTEETAASTEETTAPTEESTASTEESTASTEESTDSTEETTASTEETTASTEETTAPAEETTSPTEETTAPTEESTSPADDVTEPTDAPVLPSEGIDIPDIDIPEPTLPTVPEIEIDPSQYYAPITADAVEGIVADFSSNTVFEGAAAAVSLKMSESTIRATIQAKLAGFTDVLTGYFGSSFYVDQDALAQAFQFTMTQEDLMRLMNAMSASDKEATAQSNLLDLGYADLAEPSSISVYLKDFDGKEKFLNFIDSYNEKMEALEQEEQVISYTDVTGILMSSVSTIINSVTYVLIAFVAVSLVVSSIMIGIITLISVQERTKEIGILRAIGASKRNISQVFNAETFIVGLCSGLIGVGMTLLLNIPINLIIHDLTGTSDINAQLPAMSALILVVLSMMLTLFGGLIPSRKAAKKDPVIALRSE